MHALARKVGRLAVGAALAMSLNACEGGGSDTPNVVAPVILPNTFTVTRLTGDDASQQAAHIDANLVNPWGISFDSTGVLWAANNSTGTSTLHTATGVAQPPVVRIPSDLTITGGSPTGIAVNLTNDFAIAGSGPAAFIFVSEDGLITAWNAAAGATAMRVASRVVNRSMYTAATLASSRGENHLYATDFRNNAVDVFDSRFTYVWSFTDETLPDGYAPYGIQNIA